MKAGSRTFLYQTLLYQTHLYQTHLYQGTSLPRHISTMDTSLPRHLSTKTHLYHGHLSTHDTSLPRHFPTLDTSLPNSKIRHISTTDTSLLLVKKDTSLPGYYDIKWYKIQYIPYTENRYNIKPGPTLFSVNIFLIFTIYENMVKKFTIFAIISEGMV